MNLNYIYNYKHVACHINALTNISPQLGIGDVSVMITGEVASQVDIGLGKCAASIIFASRSRLTAGLLRASTIAFQVGLLST